MKSIQMMGAVSIVTVAALWHPSAMANTPTDLSALGLKTIPVATNSSCELLAPLHEEKPLVRPKPKELNVFGFGTDCPREIETAEGTALVVTFKEYRIFGYAFVAFRPNGAAMKVVRNFSAKRRGFSGFRGFRYVFYASPSAK